MVIVHGAGSRKESHHDFARAARGYGLAAVAFDQRGHGDTGGELGAEAVDDVATMADVLRDAAPGPIALRGSSLGGWMALVAARPAGAEAVVAICPAGSEHLLRGLASQTFDFPVDEAGLKRLLEEHDAQDAVAQMEDVALLLLHAEGDEVIPYAHSVALDELATSPRRKLIVLPGGHHRSIQHDAELQGESLRFVCRAFADARERE